MIPEFILTITAVLRDALVNNHQQPVSAYTGSGYCSNLQANPEDLLVSPEDPGTTRNNKKQLRVAGWSRRDNARHGFLHQTYSGVTLTVELPDVKQDATLGVML